MTRRHPIAASAAELEKLCVAPSSSLVAAMRTVEEQSIELAFVRGEDNRIIGTLSDGDIRRAILRGVPVDAPFGVRDAMQASFRWVSETEGRADVLELMKALSIAQIPVLNASGHIVGLHLLYDLISRRERPNRAVIMAGGKGTRLRPITEQIPKPMVAVAGRPILERIVLHLVSHGIREISIAINYLGEMIEEHFGDGRRFGCSIQYLRETEPRGSGGALSLLSDQSAPLLVLNGDLVTQFDVDDLFDFHEGGSFIATLGVRPYAIDIPFGVVESERGVATAIREKPTHRCLINAGVYVISPELLRRIPPTGEFPITDLFVRCIEGGERVGVRTLDGDWVDVGHHESLKLARGQAQ